MSNKVLLWIMLVVPWSSLILMKPRSIKRYAPVVLLSMWLLTVTQEIAYTNNWWKNLDKIVSWGSITNISLMYGTFSLGTYWIFYFTFGSFWIYLLTNAVIDGIWLIFIPPYFDQIGIFRFGPNMNAWILFLICTVQAVILYGYQVWQEGIYKEEVNRNENGMLNKALRLAKLGGGKEPAR